MEAMIEEAREQGQVVRKSQGLLKAKATEVALAQRRADAKRKEKEIRVSEEAGAQVSRQDMKHVAVLSGRVQKKWDQLDVDGSDTLEGEEIVALSEWVWKSFHPGKRMTAEDKQREVA
jgi:hypothetical protein